jgi:selenide,water dikinase
MITYIDDVDLAVTDLLFDPQTAGGLLLAVEKTDAQALCQNLLAEGIAARTIGKFTTGVAGRVEVSMNGKIA